MFKNYCLKCVLTIFWALNFVVCMQSMKQSMSHIKLQVTTFRSHAASPVWQLRCCKHGLLKCPNLHVLAEPFLVSVSVHALQHASYFWGVAHDSICSHCSSYLVLPLRIKLLRRQYRICLLLCSGRPSWETVSPVDILAMGNIFGHSKIHVRLPRGTLMIHCCGDSVAMALCCWTQGCAFNPRPQLQGGWNSETLEYLNLGAR